MTSPAKMSRDESSPRSLDTNGSRFASPSTAPTAYSPAETRNFSSMNLQSMLVERFAGLATGSKTAEQPDDPFTENRSQPAYLSATAAPYQPTVRAPITELNKNSTPERLSTQTRHQYSLPALGRSLAAALGSPSGAAPFNIPPNSTSFNLQSGGASFNLNSGTASLNAYVPINGADNASPKPSLMKQSLAPFTSDPENDGMVTNSRYLSLSNVDAYDIDERNPRSRLAEFRQVRPPSARSFHTSLITSSSAGELHVDLVTDWCDDRCYQREEEPDRRWSLLPFRPS
jgi:hypothetical protein